jgi:prepilin-type N-terminal cleavage/methylation domain-containing protein
MRKLNQQGYNLVELMIAVAILAALASSVILARSFMAKQTVITSDKSYATEKAIQMFEELKALVNGQEKAGVNVLDNYSDGSLYNKVLTTDKTVDITPVGSGNPGDPLSGNRMTNGHWRYLRQVTVNRVADPYTRQVIIKIWLYDGDTDPNNPGPLLAEVGGMLRTITNVFPPTQVMDVYVLAVQNISAWWAQLPVIYQTFENIVTDIQERNPGLEIRPHYITRSSYGRDGFYYPYINKGAGIGSAYGNASGGTDNTTTGGAIPYVYFYPGLTPGDNGTFNCSPGPGTESDYYDPSATGVPVDGFVNIDGTINSTGSLFQGCPAYTMADRHNNSMRYPDELAMYQAVTSQAANYVAGGGALPANFSVTEMSERMLFENMLSNPASFTNALIVNLHGELLPIPPMRNYSDAAKDPGNLQGNGPDVRLAVHPENLYNPTGAASYNLHLRVHAYIDGMDDMTQLEATYPDDATHTPPVIRVANIFLPGQIVNPLTGITARAVTGNAQNPYGNGSGLSPGSAVTSVANPPDNPMSIAATIIANSAGVTGTEILLYDTPVRCAMNAATTTGLNAVTQLYNCEYIPCLIGTTAGNWTELSTAGNGPKNTTRWLVQVPVTPPAGGGPITIEARIGTGVSSGDYGVAGCVNYDPNLERTYAWVGNNNIPPWTERYQFLGDPRHEPYQDTKLGTVAVFGSGTYGVTLEANSYNWWFKNFNGTVDGYSGFGQAAANTGWGGDSDEVDMPRFYEMIRKGLENTTSIWTTMNGWSYYYYGMGSEFGSDQPPFTNGITINSTPWNTTAKNTNTTVSEIINYQGAINKMKVISNTTDTWFEKYWQGELYPNSAYNTWKSSHNLPVATNAISNATFYRKDYSAVPSTATITGFGRSFTSRVQGDGCTSFFNGSGGYDHNGPGCPGDTAAATLLAPLPIYNIYQYPLPPNVNTMRPWNINAGNQAREWGIAPYPSLRTTLSIPSVGATSRLYYVDNSGGGSYTDCTGVVQVLDTSSGATQIAYVLESGLAISADVGTNDLGKTAMVILLRTFLDGGLMAGGGQPGHVVQVPLIKVYCDSLVAQYFQPTQVDLMVSGAVTNGTPYSISGFITVGSGPTTNIWYRYPGITSNTANFYTEEYPGASGALTGSSYAETVVGGAPITLDMNLKYSNNSGKTWMFIQDNMPAQAGILDPTAGHLIQTTTMPVTYQWNVANTSTFPQGDYWIRAEAYRTGLMTDYAYHVLDIAIDR